MKKQLSTAQFVECAYCWFHGETFTEIADRFSVTSQALTNLKKRRKAQWDAMIAELTTGHLEKLASDNAPSKQLSEAEKRANGILFREISTIPSEMVAIQRLKDRLRCSEDDAKRYLAGFQQHLQITLFDKDPMSRYG